MCADAALEYNNVRIDGSGLLAKIQLIEILSVIFVASTTGHDGPPPAYRISSLSALRDFFQDRFRGLEFSVFVNRFDYERRKELDSF